MRFGGVRKKGEMLGFLSQRVFVDRAGGEV